MPKYSRFIDLGQVTCEDAAEVHSARLGRPVEVGHPEFLVMDDLENPGGSADFPTFEMAREYAPEAELSDQVKAWLETQPDGLGKSPLWLQLDKDEALFLFRHLEQHAGMLGAIREKMRVGLSDNNVDEDFRQAAVEKFAGRLQDGDLDFQTDGLVSKGDEGAYVMAFLWVNNAEAGLEPEEGDNDPEPGL